MHLYLLIVRVDDEKSNTNLILYLQVCFVDEPHFGPYWKLFEGKSSCLAKDDGI